MCHCGQVASDVLDLRRDMLWVREHIHRIEMRQEEYHMSEDAAIQAAVTEITSDVAALTALVQQALAEIAASATNSVQPSTVAALQQAVSGLDSENAAFSAGLNPPPPPPPAPTA